ncbi:MAG: Ig domain-containing protein, partial [Blastocatellia bacterium]
TYIHTLEATGGVAPYTWSLAAGRLPSQLTLDRTTGAIRGRPDKKGTLTFVVRVRDSQPSAAEYTRTLSIRIVR